ncbi:MAG: transaldolase [Terriglobia bacterium]
MDQVVSAQVGNPLLGLQTQGQSIWLDSISRQLLRSGQLKKLIDEDGLRGVTSNPTIFEKAITGSHDYDPEMDKLSKQGASVDEIYEALVVEDIQAATDLFQTVYRETQGLDGYVSLEVSPRLAHQTDKTIEEARRLWKRVSRPNVMIKVPATPEGIPAIETLISEGINVNVTLMFSPSHYVSVAEAYLRGLEIRARNGQPLRLGSVASFFVSRVDTLIDRLLDQALAASKGQEALIQSLMGQAAIANSRLVYQKFKEIFSESNFGSLRKRGARVQRPLWASTSTKNPKYRDVLYVEELIGPETVNTLPPATVDAFRDHGKVSARLEQDLDAAKILFTRLAALGIDIEQVGKTLQTEGVKLFLDSFETLIRAIAAKKESLSH